VKVSVGFERLFDYQILYLSTDEASWRNQGFLALAPSVTAHLCGGFERNETPICQDADMDARMFGVSIWCQNFLRNPWLAICRLPIG
jgi:hypothetical protein